MTALALLSLLCAAVPAILFVRNLHVFRPPACAMNSADDVSILIPARNEERNIQGALEAALANTGAEVLVLDDSSTDGTREIVAKIFADLQGEASAGMQVVSDIAESGVARVEGRAHLIQGEPLPNEWCGKNWACAQLAKAATRPVLLFVDADVRLAPEAAASISNWMRQNGVQLASGVPRQEFGGFSQRLLIPLIHFVLLGFLPLRRMRESRHPAYATGCGQLVIADAAAYRGSGGHAAIRDRIHDGLALPKLFRQHNFRTDLFDATEMATCRMYRTGAETWRGFAKNTHEGLGAPARILPATFVLFVGQVMPFLLIAIAPHSGIALLAATLALFPRVLAARRFSQPIASIILHPIAILALLGIQWAGLIRFLRGKSVSWKGRAIEIPGSARLQRAGEGILPSELS